MLKIADRYTQADPSSGNYPYGSIKNSTSPTAGDGTPVDKDWLNDYVGFSDALLAQVNHVPSGLPDTVVTSDRLLAMIELIKQIGLQQFQLSMPSLAQLKTELADRLSESQLSHGDTVMSVEYYGGFGGGAQYRVYQAVSDAARPAQDGVIGGKIVHIDGVTGSEGWYLNMITEGDKINILCFGAKGDDLETSASANVTAFNSASVVADGKTIFIPSGSYLFNGTVDHDNRNVSLEGEHRAYGTANAGTKLAYLPATGYLFDCSNSSYWTAKGIAFDGGWYAEGNPPLYAGPDGITSDCFYVLTATYFALYDCEFLRFGSPVHQPAASDTIYGINFYNVFVSGCTYAVNIEYQCNNFNWFGGWWTNCAYGFRLKGAGAQLGFKGVDFQIQGLDQIAGSWEKADGHLFNIEDAWAVDFDNGYVEINGSNYAGGEQYLGNISRVQQFNLAKVYVTNSGSANPNIPLINATDCAGIVIAQISPYKTQFPGDMVWVNCLGTTNPHLVVGFANTMPDGHIVSDTTFNPKLYLNGALSGAATYESSFNYGKTFYDGKNITVCGLMAVTNWGLLPAGQNVGIELPVQIDPAAYEDLQVAAFGPGSNGGNQKLLCRIVKNDATYMRIQFDSDLSSVLTDNALASIYFEIRYQPLNPAITI